MCVCVCVSVCGVCVCVCVEEAGEGPEKGAGSHEGQVQERSGAHPDHQGLTSVLALSHTHPLPLSQSRGVTVGDGEEDGEGLQEIDLTCPHPSGERVHLTPDGTLVWPVLFLYPEFGETDLIQEFRESDRFIDHLREVFSQPPPWDQHCHYTLPALRVCLFGALLLPW